MKNLRCFWIEKMMIIARCQGWEEKKKKPMLQESGQDIKRGTTMLRCAAVILYMNIIFSEEMLWKV